MGYEVVRFAHCLRRTRVGARSGGAPQFHPSSFFRATYHLGKMTAELNVRNDSFTSLRPRNGEVRVTPRCRQSASATRRANHLGDFSTPLSSPFCKNILIFRSSKSPYNPRRPVPQRGGSRSSRTRDRMRWTQAAPKTRAFNCGRQNRVVLTPRRWRQVLGKQASQGRR